MDALTETEQVALDYTIKGEFAMNGVKNDLKHTTGVLSMARTMVPDSAGSQFFVMVADAPHLDGQMLVLEKSQKVSMRL